MAAVRKERPRHSRRGGPNREHMRIRHQLLQLILEIARRDQLKDYNIAAMCGTSRPRGSNLLHGHMALFNSETLIDILARLGVTIEITVVRRRPYLRSYFANPRPGWKPPRGFAY